MSSFCCEPEKDCRCLCNLNGLFFVLAYFEFKFEFMNSKIKSNKIKKFSQIKIKDLKTAATTGRTTRTIYEDEKLAEEVRKYPCLYGKTDKGYKVRDRLNNG